MKLRIEEAIASARLDGRKVLKKDLAAQLWPDSTEVAQQVNMTNLINGSTQRFCADWIVTICKMTGCSADFLFGIE